MQLCIDMFMYFVYGDNWTDAFGVMVTSHTETHSNGLGLPPILDFRILN